MHIYNLVYIARKPGGLFGWFLDHRRTDGMTRPGRLRQLTPLHQCVQLPDTCGTDVCGWIGAGWYRRLCINCGKLLFRLSGCMQKKKRLELKYLAVPKQKSHLRRAFFLLCPRFSMTIEYIRHTHLCLSILSKDKHLLVFRSVLSVCCVCVFS